MNVDIKIDFEVGEVWLFCIVLNGNGGEYSMGFFIELGVDYVKLVWGKVVDVELFDVFFCKL